MAFYLEYRALVVALEEKFSVEDWRLGDVDIWPLARMALYLELHQLAMGALQEQKLRPFGIRVCARILTPLLNIWRCRRDLAHWIGWPKKSEVVFLGDGVSLDFVDRAWRDCFAEPLAKAEEKMGRRFFLMQRGGFSRMPWQRATFPTNVVDAWGWLLSWSVSRSPSLPNHGEVLQFVSEQGFNITCLKRRSLIEAAVRVSSSAIVFGWILGIVQPRLAFVVSYYAGLGPAFVLACRRLGIPCVDIQRAPQEVGIMAYGLKTPARGYTTLPDYFWTWTEGDAENIDRWARPRHQAFAGGDLRLPGSSVAPSRKGVEANFAREILVALQPIGGHRRDWETLADQIITAPTAWRWWIRRHPASSPEQDKEFGRLLELRLPNVFIEEAAVPLLSLLSIVNVVVSLESGTSIEAARFCIPSLFLSQAAGELFSSLIEKGQARIVDADTINAEIARLSPQAPHVPKDLGAENALKLLDEFSAQSFAPGRWEALSRPAL